MRPATALNVQSHLHSVLKWGPRDSRDGCTSPLIAEVLLRGSGTVRVLATLSWGTRREGFTHVDVTEEFSFLVTKMSPYLCR